MADNIDEAMATFLANGGVIQQIDRNVSGFVEGQTYWGQPKRPGRPAASATPKVKKDESESEEE